MVGPKSEFEAWIYETHAIPVLPRGILSVCAMYNSLQF